MAQIGTIKVETAGGPVELPVYELGDSGSDRVEAFRVQTASGPGFVPLTDVSAADRPYLRVQTGNGVKAFDTSASGILDSVVSRWQFNGDADTSTATDSERSNDGTINGASYTTTAQEGSHALDFEASNGDSVVVSNDASLEPSAVSVVAWMRPESLTTFQRLLHKGMGSVKYGMSTDDASDHITAFWDGGGGEEVEAFATSFTAGTWYHVGFGADANGVDVYVNGSPDNGSGAATNWGDNSSDLRIGERSGGDTGYWDGIIDDVMIANEKWSDQTFADVYNLY